MKKYFKLGGIVIVLGGTGFTLWLLRELWLWLTSVNPNVLAMWALLATLALPIIALGGLLLGRREAGVKVDGLDLGIEKVMGMAEKVADIRDRSAAQTRQPPVTVQVAAGALPAPQMYHKQLEGEAARVDL